MGFTDDQYSTSGKGEGWISDAIPEREILSQSFSQKVKSTNKNEYFSTGLYINEDNPFKDTDYNLIIKTFEVECSEWREDDYAVVYHYRDVYNTRRFSYRVQQQLNYYPGMHQVVPVGEDPTKEQAKRMGEQRLQHWNRALEDPDSFMSGLKSREKDFDYREIFGGDRSVGTRAENLGKLLTECIPCFDRLLDGADFLPDADLLELHLMNIKLRTDILDKLKSLLSDPGFYLDICDLLDMLSKMCPQDLLAILALLSQYLAKLNLDIRFNLDVIVELVGSILSPFLDALADWLDKWIQVILAPLVCVVNHINETILLAQQVKIPLAETNIDVGADVGVALPFHENVSVEGEAGQQGAPWTKESKWAKAEFQEFETPDEQKYNPNKPTFPEEVIERSGDEIKQEFAGMEGIDPALGLPDEWTEEEREAKNKRWAELRKEEREKRMKIPPPLQRPDPDGRKWYKEEAKDVHSKTFETGMRPPEEQNHPKQIDQYYLDPSPIVNSVLQLRNILQAGIAYVQDWFEYVTQMIHDLLGTDFGWMNKKTDTTILKSRIIQLIYLIKALIDAISQNGLRCGVDSNFDQQQLKYVLETVMNSKSVTYQFAVNSDGSVEVIPPDGPLKAETIQLAQSHLEDKGEIIPRPGEEPSVNEQKSVASGIVIKNCLKRVAAEDLNKVRTWIADFEKKK